MTILFQPKYILEDSIRLRSSKFCFHLSDEIVLLFSVGLFGCHHKLSDGPFLIHHLCVSMKLLLHLVLHSRKKIRITFELTTAVDTCQWGSQCLTKAKYKRCQAEEQCQRAAVLTRAAGQTGRCLGVIGAACETNCKLWLRRISGHWVWMERPNK